MCSSSRSTATRCGWTSIRIALPSSPCSQTIPICSSDTPLGAAIPTWSVCLSARVCLRTFAFCFVYLHEQSYPNPIQSDPIASNPGVEDVEGVRLQAVLLHRVPCEQACLRCCGLPSSLSAMGHLLSSWRHFQVRPSVCVVLCVLCFQRGINIHLSSSHHIISYHNS